MKHRLPQTRRAPGWIVSVPIAHRGLHDATRPENSMAAFEAAARNGYAIELDVRASADGDAIVFHDRELDRLTAASGPVASRTGSWLRRLPLGGTRETIPSLEDVLDVVGTRVPVVVELKNDGVAGELEHRVAETLGRRHGEYAVQSFNPRSILWFRRHHERWPRGLLATDFKDEPLPRSQKIVLRNLLTAPGLALAYVGYELRCLPFWAPSWARRLGIPVVAWTVRAPADLLRARRLADNVIFEDVRPTGQLRGRAMAVD